MRANTLQLQGDQGIPSLDETETKVLATVRD
jgi:hypothetical protein